MAIKKFSLTEENKKLTLEQLEELKKAAEKSFVEDPEFPPFTPEQLAQFKRVSEINKEERANNKKQNVTIRLSPQALSKAKSLGKGYTSVLSRILENALNDNEMIKKCL